MKRSPMVVVMAVVLLSSQTPEPGARSSSDVVTKALADCDEAPEFVRTGAVVFAQGKLRDIHRDDRLAHYSSVHSVQLTESMREVVGRAAAARQHSGIAI